jgi:valyl-tRNA synthetase
LRFDAAANAIYHFVWDRFCDWYLELIKGQVDAETKAVAGWVLDQILVMLHPFMPFITEELWHAQGERPYALIVAKWPEPGAKVDKAAKAEVDWLIEFTSNLRAAKNELGISPGAKLEAFIPNASDRARKGIAGNAASLERLARLSAIHSGPAPEGAALQVSAGGDLFVIPLAGVIDIGAEKARLARALEASAKEAKALEGRLANPSFVERAKPEAVDKARADHAHHAAEVARLEAALARLG